MANERSVDFVLRAQIGQALSPMDQVTARVNTLTAALAQQSEAAKTGDTSATAYAKTLRDLEKASAALLQQRSALSAFEAAQSKVNDTQAKQSAALQGRDAFAASIPSDAADRTRDQSKALASLDRDVKTTTRSFDAASKSYAAAVSQLERIGVATDQVEAAQLRLSESIQQASQSLSKGQGQSDVLAETLRAAGVQKQVAAQRKADAEDNVKEQRLLQTAVTDVWAAEDAGAAKAAASIQTFREAMQRATAQADAARAAAVRQTVLVAAPATLPATPIAAQVHEALAPPSSPGTGPTDLATLQSQVDKLTAAISTGAGSVAKYTAELRGLDAVATETLRQSGVVDGFLKAQAAAEAAVKAFQVAQAQLKQLRAELDTATTAQQLSEVTSAIARLQTQIGEVGRNGLANNAREALDALSAEESKLSSIGVTAATVGDAITRLTTIAVQTSQSRTAALSEEQKALDSEVIATLRRSAAIDASRNNAAVAPQGAVAQVAATRLPDVRDANAAIDALDASLGKGKLTGETLNKVLQETETIFRSITADASFIDSWTRQAAAVRAAEVEYQKAAVSLERVSAAALAGKASLLDLQRAEAALNGAASNVQAQIGQQQQLDAQLKARRIDTANLTGEIDKLTAAGQRLATVQERAKSSAGTAFGLSPYQFTNLQFQVNDVITQLSLGQGILRTFESQAGQIFQIFDLSLAQMARFALYGAPAAAAIVLVVSALERLKETADASRAFTGILASNIDGIAYQSKALVEAQRQLEAVGVSFANAGKAAKEFLGDGLNTDRIIQFTRAAQDLADSRGVDFDTAVKQISSIATGSFDDLRKLDDMYNVLSADQIAYVKAQFDAGNADQGRVAFINAFSAAMRRAADESLSPFTVVVRSLKTSWDALLDTLGSTTAITTIANGLKSVLDSITQITNLLKGENNTAALLDALDRLSAFGAKLSPFAVVMTNIANAFEKLSGTKLPSLPTLTQAGQALGVVDTRGLPPAFQNLPPPDSRVNRQVPADVLATIAAVTAITGQSESSLQALFRNEAGARNADGSFVPGKMTASGQAQGAFQVLPTTFAEVVRENQTTFDALATTLGKKIDIQDTDFNTLAAALYLKKQTDANYGNGALGAAAYNAGPGSLAAILSGQKTLPAETAQYVSNFLAMRGGPAATSGPVPQATSSTGLTDALRNQGVSEQDIKRNAEVLENIQKQTSALSDDTLTGEALLAQNAAKVVQFAKDQQTAVTDALKGSPQSAATTTALKALVDQFGKKLQDDFDKKVRDANNAALQVVESATIAANRADVSNPEAQRKVIDAQYAKQISELQQAIAHGAVGIGADAMQAALDGLVKARDQLKEQSTIKVDTTIVTDVVKARDDAITAVQTDLKAGTTSVAAAYAKITEIVKTSTPKIQAAVAQANSDLSRQPQTAAIGATTASINKTDVVDQKAFTSTDDIEIAKINQLLAARNDLEKTYNDEVSQGILTRQEADTKIVASYQKVKPQIIELTTEVQKQLDLQLSLGEISQETYEKYSAAVKKAATSTNDLTATQKKFVDQMDNSVVTHAVQGFETIANATGAAIAGTGTWADALKSLGTAFAQFTAGVLKDLAEIIIKQTLLNSLQGSAGSGGFLGSVASFFGFGGGAGAAAGAGSQGLGSGASLIQQGLYHGGGIAGSGTMSRAINPAVFIGAARFHSGGMPGLSGDEVPAILQKGEEVVTQGDPRHRNNARGAGGTGNTQSIRNVLVMDQSEVAAAMAGSAGERVVLSHLKRKAPQVRQLLGVRGT